ncbi:hypothetical protein PG997_011952 [Apiospora hydei]|uniref:Uncharacterized protein n=1 Tax=Apiospora hydei TaxID=1337664 RepID=A0ABR1V1Z0_9PEZI
MQPAVAFALAVAAVANASPFGLRHASPSHVSAHPSGAHPSAHPSGAYASAYDSGVVNAQAAAPTPMPEAPVGYFGEETPCYETCIMNGETMDACRVNCEPAAPAPKKREDIFAPLFRPVSTLSTYLSTPCIPT